MLQLLTTDEFASWFAALDDATAEDVATALEVTEQLGPDKAPPGSREALLWYEHPRAARFGVGDAFSWDLESWGEFRDYTGKILAQLESPRFLARLPRLGDAEASRVLRVVRQIKRAADPRVRWQLRVLGEPRSAAGSVRPETASAEVRRLYFEALDAAGFAVADVPAHSRALREISRRAPGAPFRLLYGVDAERAVALFVLGERLDRSFYGDSVRRAEAMWSRFLDGALRVEPAQRR